MATIIEGTGSGGFNNAISLASEAKPSMPAYQIQRCKNVNEWR